MGFYQVRLMVGRRMAAEHQYVRADRDRRQGYFFHWPNASRLTFINVVQENQNQRQDSTRKKGLALSQGLIYERKFQKT